MNTLFRLFIVGCTVAVSWFLLNHVPALGTSLATIEGFHLTWRLVVIGVIGMLVWRQSK